MIKKIEDLTYEEAKKICSNYNKCANCPLDIDIPEYGTCWIELIKFNELMKKDIKKQWENEVEVIEDDK